MITSMDANKAYVEYRSLHEEGPFVTAFPVSPPLLAENGLSSEPYTAEAFFF